MSIRLNYDPEIIWMKRPKPETRPDEIIREMESIESRLNQIYSKARSIEGRLRGVVQQMRARQGEIERFADQPGQSEAIRRQSDELIQSVAHDGHFFPQGGGTSYQPPSLFSFHLSTEAQK